MLHLKFRQLQAFRSLNWESDCELRMKVDWDVTLCRCVSGSRRPDGSHYVRVVESLRYGSIILRNIWNHSPKNTLSHFRKFELSATPIRLWNCSRFWDEAPMTYCTIISDKFRYCHLVNSDPAPCVLFWDVCRMRFLCDGMLLNMPCTLLFDKTTLLVDRYIGNYLGFGSSWEFPIVFWLKYFTNSIP